MVYGSRRYKRYKRARSASKRYKPKYSAYKTSYRRRKYSSQPTQKYGWRGNLSIVKRAVSSMAERKWVDTGFQTAEIYDSFSGTMFLTVNGIAQGDGQSQRIGKEVTLTSVQVEGCFMPQNELVEAQRVRMLLVWDESPNSTAATIDQILQTSGPNAAFAFMNLSYRQRFRILAEETFTIGFVKEYGTAPDVIRYTISPVTANVSRYVKLNHKCVYSGTTNSATSIATGALYLLVVGSCGVLGPRAITFNCNVRVRYTDI